MKVFYISLLATLSFILSHTCYANDYVLDNGYEVELYWKVKHHKQLIVWGAVEKGKKCKQLKINVSMKHKKGEYERFEKIFRSEHTRMSRSAFKFKAKNPYRSFPDKGWYPKYLNVECMNYYQES